MEFLVKTLFPLVLLMNKSNSFKICNNTQQIFDPINAVCRQCGLNELKIKNTCKCDEFSLLQNNICVRCPEGMIKDYFNQTCIPLCPKCSTCSQTLNTYLMLNNPDGSAVSKPNCETCDQNSVLVYKNGFLPQCIPCGLRRITDSLGNCNCLQNEEIQLVDICVSISIYNSFITSNPILSSSLFSSQNSFFSTDFGNIETNLTQTLIKYEFLCLRNNITEACIALSNFCSLTLNTNSFICQNARSSQLVYTQRPVFNPMAFDENINDRFSIQIFTENGELKEITKASTKLFGLNSFQSIPINFAKNIFIEDLIELNFDEKPLFYRPVFTLSNGTFVSIPVLTTNDSLSNFDSSFFSKIADNEFFFTFFSHYKLFGTQNKIIRVLKDIILTIKIDSSGNYNPILVASYQDRQISALPININRSFTLTFFSSNTRFWILACIIICIIAGVVLIISLIYACLKKHRNTNNLNEDGCSIMILLSFMWTFPIISLLTMFCGWIYLLVTQKFIQSNSTVFPATNLFPLQYLGFLILIILDILFLLLYLLLKIIRESSFPIEIIDWEEPNIVRIINNKITKTTSMWRYVNFITDLQKWMIIDKSYSSIVSLMTMVVFNGFRLDQYTFLPINQLFFESNDHFQSGVLRFFWIISIFNVIGILFRLCSKLSESIFDGSVYDNLVDFCSICNISIIIHKHKRRVTYIHGKSSFLTGEGSLSMIYKKLKLEANPEITNRGIISESDVQVFDVLQLFSETNKEKNIVEEIKSQIIGGKCKVFTKSFSERVFGWKSTQQNSELVVGPHDNGVIFLAEENDYISRHFYDSLSGTVLIFLSLIIGIFDFLCGSLIVGVIIAGVVKRLIQEFHNGLLKKNLKFKNLIDERFLK